MEIKLKNGTYKEIKDINNVLVALIPTPGHLRLMI